MVYSSTIHIYTSTTIPYNKRKKMRESSLLDDESLYKNIDKNEYNSNKNVALCFNSKQ